jgi:hypothetical protein
LSPYLITLSTKNQPFHSRYRPPATLCVAMRAGSINLFISFYSIFPNPTRAAVTFIIESNQSFWGNRRYNHSLAKARDIDVPNPLIGRTLANCQFATEHLWNESEMADEIRFFQCEYEPLKKSFYFAVTFAEWNNCEAILGAPLLLPKGV